MPHRQGDCAPLRSPPPPPWLADRFAFDDWVRRHMPLVKGIARQLKHRVPSSIEEDDLLQWGLLGLMQARKRFTGRQTQFGAFARRRIWGAMLDGLREGDPAPRELRRITNRILRNASQLEQSLGRRPTGTEIAAKSGVTLSQYHQLRSEISAYQQIDVQSEDDLSAFQHRISTPEPLQLLIDRSAQERLWEAIDQLPERERTLLHWRLNGHLKLRRIASKLGVTESRVSQLLRAASKALSLKLAREEAGRPA